MVHQVEDGGDDAAAAADGGAVAVIDHIMGTITE